MIFKPMKALIATSFVVLSLGAAAFADDAAVVATIGGQPITENA